MLLSLFFSAIAFATPTPTVHHELKVQIQPELSRIVAQDLLTFSEPGRHILSLNKNLQIENSKDLSSTLIPTGRVQGEIAEYELNLQNEKQLLIRYSGILNYPLNEELLSGSITPQGAVLLSGLGWYPHVADLTLQFRLQANLPEGWSLVTEEGDKDLLDIDFVAAPFFVTSKNQSLVYLRKSDPELANKYLVATEAYLKYYSETIAPYPFQKFSVVENIWETGYGMPGFTLLGPSVIRLPFILNSSLPHEILHNWWGNSVYVDYDKGNWCEGLTSYMADHEMQSRTGQAANYRRSAIQAYQDYSSSGRDFPLREFHGRHNNVTQAVGYNKAMMFFHMLKVRFGSEIFQKSLQHFYQSKLFQKASFQDIQQSFESISGQHLESFFHQWVDQTGMPQIELISAWFSQGKMKVYLRQKQETLYDLNIPVQFYDKQGNLVAEDLISLRTKELLWKKKVSKKPSKIVIDPHHDVLRHLYIEEIPVSHTSFFSQEGELNFIAPSVYASQYENFGMQMGQSLGRPPVVSPDTRPVPENASFWLLGWENAHLQLVNNWGKDFQIEARKDGIQVGKMFYPASEYSVSLMLRNPAKPTQILAWTSAHHPDFLPRLGQKIPHYGKFSLVIFKSETNVVKSQWPTVTSPLAKEIP
ncbi:MAG: peptidase M1 [Oligoflexia bacterium]|nr:MAG: peptidase M1 [Oligoflexia bacterium]